ncbi:MAG: exodeoxyribonuclease VII large subunit [Prevotellaceae bacterium]|jgi:exodeoxyribonuclease VII large subunit|nr:exodeoxyribonuclease VII large subunit [Prevotellaceae bacterium]
MRSLSLKELQLIVKQAIDALPDTYWVMAEINELRESGAGHCFLELVQKDADSEQIEAKVSANIWVNVYRMLKDYFAFETGMALGKGMKVLVRVAVQYHELYGLRLNILDIDAAYTVGEVALLRKNTIAQLRADGVFDMNRALELPLLPRGIAIISSETAAGYGDFMHQLHHNSYGYTFRTALFQAAMQGRDAEPSIIGALEQVYERASEFDVVAILRGGGSQSDLSCFDSYALASNVAQFPLPVITGIGHDRDVSVVDMVAHANLKTPTAAAEFLIERLAEQEARMEGLWEALSKSWSSTLTKCRDSLQRFQVTLGLYAQHYIQQERRRITDHLPQRLSQAALQSIARRRLTLDRLGSELKLADPATILQRGYSITLKNGALLRSAGDAQQGDRIETILHDGKVTSRVVGEE